MSRPSWHKNVFIVSAVNYRYEQKSLSKRYQSHTICPLLPLLESARKRTAPRKVDLYDVFCAILYLQRTGCSWRALPGDFPKWRTVHSYFQRWSEPRENGISLLEEALKNQVVAERRKQGRNEATTFLIIDAQSVRTRIPLWKKATMLARK